jgi:hypothetical protein
MTHPYRTSSAPAPELKRRASLLDRVRRFLHVHYWERVRPHPEARPWWGTDFYSVHDLEVGCDCGEWKSVPVIADFSLSESFRVQQLVNASGLATVRWS